MLLLTLTDSQSTRPALAPCNCALPVQRNQPLAKIQPAVLQSKAGRNSGTELTVAHRPGQSLLGENYLGPQLSSISFSRSSGRL